MAHSSILGADRAPSQAQGRDLEALGPSDTSDSGSDVQGVLDLASPADLDSSYAGVQPGLASDSDSTGTGERGSALLDEEAMDGRDISPDQIRSMGDTVDDEPPFDASLDVAELDEFESLAADDESDEDADDGN